ncbi:hypothetical protein TrCOL_g6590 [Triparma columacea]|uniref:Uncharacterized protein n=1 Tax=Triparma columacea TaxID=722753 RepID=A0A9W7FX60_9STRA|nr:hypothetical protein TrCOL_g6590 [Triparma columacea]
MFLKALLEEKESRKRKDVEGRRKKEEAKNLLEAGMRRMEVGTWEILQELKEKKEECEKLREMLDWMKAEVGR